MSNGPYGIGSLEAKIAATSGQNIGSSGGGVFKEKVGDNLRFRRIVQGSNAIVTETADTIVISGLGGGEGGASVHNSLSGRSELDCHPIESITLLPTVLATKVDKVSGKALSTEDFTTAYKDNLVSLTRLISTLSGIVSVEEFGAVGDGIVNDRDSLISAMNFARDNNKLLVLQPGKNYYCATRIDHTGSLNLHCIGGTATISAGTNNDLMRIQHSAFSFSDTTAQFTTSLTANALASTNSIQVSDAGNIAVGDFIELRSNALWPHDNRGVAYKSELNKVTSISGAVVQLASQVNQTFTAAESVVRIIKPINVNISNISFVGNWSGNNERVGLRVVAANLKFYGSVSGFAGAGLVAYHCYKPRVKGNFDLASGASSGYGIQLMGCTLGKVSGSSYACRRGVDISGVVTPSWSCTVTDYSVMGGGVCVNGQIFGHNGEMNYGVGDHGPSAMSYYSDIRLTDIIVPFQHRGRDFTIDGAVVRGYVPNEVVSIWHVQMGTVKNVVQKRGWGGSIDGANVPSATTYPVPFCFVAFRQEYVGLTDANNRFIIQDCSCEIREAFVSSAVGGTARAIPDNLEIVDNSITFFADSNYTVSLVRNTWATSYNLLGMYDANNRFFRIGTAGPSSKLLGLTASSPMTAF